MLRAIWKRRLRGQRGMTGLETAIILIAFVVVAAVFAYTVLSAGVFSSQKSQDTVYSGLDETRSTMEIQGHITGYGSAGADVDLSGAGGERTDQSRVMTRMQFCITNTLDGEVIDVTPSYLLQGTVASPTGLVEFLPDRHRTVVQYIDEYCKLTDVCWTCEFLGDDNGDWLLDLNEKAVITVWLVNRTAADGEFRLDSANNGNFWYDTLDGATCKLADANHKFRLEIKPESGAVLIIERTLPGYLDTMNDLT